MKNDNLAPLREFVQNLEGNVALAKTFLNQWLENLKASVSPEATYNLMERSESYVESAATMLVNSLVARNLRNGRSVAEVQQLVEQQLISGAAFPKRSTNVTYNLAEQLQTAQWARMYGTISLFVKEHPECVALPKEAE